MKLIECVPNFSEGCDRSKIDDIVNHVSAVPEVTVLDVDPGSDDGRGRLEEQLGFSGNRAE